MNHTSRWTAPEPTGIDKYFQDAWDARRDSQVRTFMTMDSKTAFANFTAAVARGIDSAVAERAKARAEGAKSGEIIFVHICGSYDRTDIPDQDSKDPINTFIRQIGSSSKSPFSKALNRNNLYLAKKGCYTTGTIHYEDGSMDVVDPTKGFKMEVGGAKKFKTMKPIETLYCWIAAVV